MNGESSMEAYQLTHKTDSQWKFAMIQGTQTEAATTQRGEKGWDVAGKFKREGTYVHLWLIHVDVWQKSNQYCKAIILQLK